MWKTAAFIACVVLTASAGRAQPADGTADDDLALVKRAVQKDEGVTATSEGPREKARRGQRIDQARWFRVRIEERKGGRVKVNLPLALVRAVGDDLPADWGCGGGHRPCRLKLSEVLDLLEGGQDLVEIKDAEGNVRIWID